MSDRYHLDSYTQRAKKDRPNPQTYYALFDRNGNFGEPLAKTMSVDTAQRIVDLLNADERLKAQAATPSQNNQNKALPARVGGKWVKGTAE